MTRREVAQLQRELNHFTGHYLKYVTPLRVDGHFGHQTEKRLKLCKYYLGYVHDRVNDDVGHELHVRLRNPRQHNRYTDHASLLRGHNRRRHQRYQAQRDHQHALANGGITHFDGVPVASWMVPYLQYARRNGWRGRLVSGFRTKEYSTHLCIAMCGHSTCPGRCAGIYTRHVGRKRPDGALDVTYYWDFGARMRTCPYRPRLWNNLPVDRVHYSAYGN